MKLRRKKKESTTTAKCFKCKHILEKSDMKRIVVERHIAVMWVERRPTEYIDAYLCNLHKQNYDKVDVDGTKYKRVPEKWVPEKWVKVK